MFHSDHPVTYFPFVNPYTFYARVVVEKSVNQKASVRWRHIWIIFARTISDFQ